jgi:hypothetical protein
LADRAIVVTLKPIAGRDRRTESEVDARFDERLPEVLGALLDVVSCALKHEPTTRPDDLPRMADFARTIAAASPTLGWQPLEFLAAYAANRQDAVETILDGHLVASALREFMVDQEAWGGTASELLSALTSEERKDNKYWPRSSRSLSGKLREVAPGLRSIDMEITFGRSHEGRGIEIVNRRASTAIRPNLPGQPSLTQAIVEELPF